MVGKRVVTPRLESSKGDKRRKTNNTIARSPPPPPAISLCLVYGLAGFINFKCSGDFENGEQQIFTPSSLLSRLQFYSSINCQKKCLWFNYMVKCKRLVI